MKLTLAEIALACAARLEAPAAIANAGAIEALGYAIDSRTLLPGQLFFAVRGFKAGQNFAEDRLRIF